MGNSISTFECKDKQGKLKKMHWMKKKKLKECIYEVDPHFTPEYYAQMHLNLKNETNFHVFHCFEIILSPKYTLLQWTLQMLSREFHKPLVKKFHSILQFFKILNNNVYRSILWAWSTTTTKEIHVSFHRKLQVQVTA